MDGGPVSLEDEMKALAAQIKATFAAFVKAEPRTFRGLQRTRHGEVAPACRFEAIYGFECEACRELAGRN